MTFDAGALTGDPDLSPTSDTAGLVGSVTPSLASLTYTPGTPVTGGVWQTTPAEVGPYGPSGSLHATETTTFSVTTLGFDTTMTSSVPDTVESLTVGGSLRPDYVAPGHHDVITLHVVPTAAVGTTVAGTLYLTGFTPGSFFMNYVAFTSLYTDELAAIPYEYKVAP
jgi:hypothetical protein